MKMLRLIIFLACLVSLANVSSISAQTDLRSDSTFFNSREKTLNEWLVKTGIAQTFTVDSIIIKKTKLEVLLISRYPDIDSLTIAWNGLKQNYNMDNPEALYRKIFNFFAFELDLGKDSLSIIYRLNKKDKIAEVNYNKKKGLLVKARSFEKAYANSRSFNTINIELDKLNVSDGPAFEYPAGSSGASIKETRKKISNYLNDFYAQKGTFWYDAKFEILKERYNELTFEVTQLSNEILNDRNYFEYIRIELLIEKKDDNFDIKIDVMGKYSGGFGFLPRRSEFRNMENDFGDYLQNYQDKLALKINRILTD
jgi:hypothetical protein